VHRGRRFYCGRLKIPSRAGPRGRRGRGRRPARSLDDDQDDRREAEEDADAGQGEQRAFLGAGGLGEAEFGVQAVDAAGAEEDQGDAVEGEAEADDDVGPAGPVVDQGRDDAAEGEGRGDRGEAGPPPGEQGPLAGEVGASVDFEILGDQEVLPRRTESAECSVPAPATWRLTSK
jgi:hypothetical protein